MRSGDFRPNDSCTTGPAGTAAFCGAAPRDSGMVLQSNASLDGIHAHGSPNAPLTRTAPIALIVPAARSSTLIVDPLSVRTGKTARLPSGLKRTLPMRAPAGSVTLRVVPLAIDMIDRLVLVTARVGKPVFGLSRCPAIGMYGAATSAMPGSDGRPSSSSCVLSGLTATRGVGVASRMRRIGSGGCR